jgi:hypothetical protein
VTGKPLRDGWEADTAKRLMMQINHLQVRMDEKCNRLKTEFGYTGRIDVKTLPSVRLALAFIEKQRLAARIQAPRTVVPTTPRPADQILQPNSARHRMHQDKSNVVPAPKPAAPTAKPTAPVLQPGATPQPKGPYDEEGDGSEEFRF